ncbi:MAG TPA: O-antigen ligase family protein [Bryobacteraceae bacterium]|jgi:O-antigen ligase
MAPSLQPDPRTPGTALFHEASANSLLLVLIAAAVVAWSPRYWPVALLHVGIFALGIAWVVWNLLSGCAGRWSPLFIPMFVAGLWGSLQILAGATVYPFLTSRALLYWSANAVILFVAAQFLDDHRTRTSFLTGLVYFTGAIAILGILQYYTSPYAVYWTFPLTHHVKAVGPFVYRNQFAALVELILPLALYRVMDEQQHRWVFATLSAVMVAVVVATASRAGTLLVGIEMTLMFLLGWLRGLVSRRTLALVFGQVFVLAVAFTLVVGFQDVWSRFHQSNPYALRGKLTASTLRMIAARPVMGYGLGTWQTVYPEFATFDNSLFANEAHNDWAQWTAEGGIPFGLALAAVALGATLLAWRTLWGLGVVFVFLHSFIDYPTREPVIGAILFVLIGAMIASSAQPRHHVHSHRRAHDRLRSPAVSP